jgi:hypothetical protein
VNQGAQQHILLL